MFVLHGGCLWREGELSTISSPGNPCLTSWPRTSTRFPWGMTGGRFPSVADLTVSAPSGHPWKDPPASPPSTAFWAPAGGFPVDSPRRQRSISLCQPDSTTPHPSRVGVPTWFPDALGCRPSTAGSQGATLSTFPLVLLTHEPTCTQAIDPETPGSTLTPADTSRPSRCSGHFSNFLWRGSPWLALGSQLHGDWFPNATGLLLGAFGLSSHPMSFFPFATSHHRPNLRVPWFSNPMGPLCGPCYIPVLAPCPHPIPHPVFIPHWAASNPVARAHRILINPGIVSCSLHRSPLSTPLLPRTQRVLLRTFLSGSSGHFSHVMAPLAQLCIGTRTQRVQAAVAQHGRHYTYPH